MAETKGTTQTARDTGGVTNKLLGGLVDARVKATLDSLVIAGSEVVADTIKLFGTLPKGANIKSITLNFSVAQSSVTIDIGDSASSTRYGSALTDPQTVGETRVNGINYVVGTADGDNQIVLTIGGATLTAAQLEAQIEYTTD